MDNNNYNTNLKNVYDHMTLTQQQRQAHIDLDEDCMPSALTKNSKSGKVGDYTSVSPGRRNAKKSLLKFHQIEEFGGRQIHTCHLCENDSSAPNGFVCTNPKHLYFGTASENYLDKPEEVRKSAAAKGGKVGGKAPATDKQKAAASETGKKHGAKSGKKATKNGNHANQQHHTCPHCGKEGKGRTMKRWHYDSCKFKV